MMNILIFVPLMLVLHFICGNQPRLRDGNITFHTQSKTWAKAQTYCRTHHTDLITIRKETADLPSNYHGWIGLHREWTVHEEWRWSRGDEKLTFSKLSDDSENCVYLNNNNDWIKDQCDHEKSFICYDERLVLVEENKTWEEALEHCRTMKKMKNYTLATLKTTDDHDFARKKAQQATTEEVWTGLRYLGDEWYWVGGEPVQYQDIPSCPGERCGVLEKNSNSSFSIRDCNERRNFFCYIKP
uniref:C-type lectin domain-containing protein n=1 Tax=Poecilia reticulata TaxID=8081 RepID=A0A3P9P699_POERE